MEKFVLKNDLLIPAGTEFNNCDGSSINFASGNFEAIIGTGKDGVISIYADEYAIKELEANRHKKSNIDLSSVRYKCLEIASKLTKDNVIGLAKEMFDFVVNDNYGKNSSMVD